LKRKLPVPADAAKIAMRFIASLLVRRFFAFPEFVASSLFISKKVIK
jgi:hypothetical protein